MRGKIPKGAGIKKQTEVEVSLQDDKVIVFAASPSRPTLVELLAQVTEKNRHAEIDIGPAVGKECIESHRESEGDRERVG